jgi:PAS domain S-box-containing protein
VKSESQAVKTQTQVMKEAAFVDDPLSHSSAPDLLRSVLSQTSNTVIIADRAGTIRYINRTMPGLRMEDVVGSNLLDYVSSESHVPYRQALNHIFEEAVSEQFEVSSVGDTKWQVRLSPLVNEHGIVDRVLVVGLDQTALLNAGHLLRQSANQLNAVFAAVPLAICVMNADGRIVQCNDQFAELFGYELQELNARTIEMITHSEDVSIAWNALQELIHRQEDRSTCTIRIQKCDGSCEWAEYAASAVRDEQGALQWIVTTVTPVSVNDQFRRELADQSARLREAQSIAQVGSFHWNIIEDKLVWSEELHRIFGTSSHDFPGRYAAYFERVHPAHRTEVEQLLRQSIREGGDFSFDCRIVRPNGEVRWMLARCHVAQDAQGRSVVMDGTCQDITERKLTELLLAGERRVLESILSDDSLPDVLTILAETVEEQDDELLCWILLYEPATKQLRHGAAPSLPKEYTDKFDGTVIGPTVGSCGAAVFHRGTVIIEDIETHPNWAEYKEVSLSFGLKSCWSTPVISPTGEVLGSLAIYHRSKKKPSAYERSVVDRAVFLTGIAIERRRSEQALQESQSRYTRATAAAKVGVWEWNLETNAGYIDPNIKALAGYAEHEIDNSQDTWLSLVHPEDRQQVLDTIMNGLAESQEAFQFEHRILHRDGSICWVLARGRVDRDAQGRPIRLVGTDSDITDRVLVERAVRESETRFTQFVEGVPQIIWMNSADNRRHLFVNSAYEQIMGLSAKELLSNPSSWLDIVHPADRERIAAHRANLEPRIRVEEFRIVRTDGRERWLQNRVIPILNDQGDVYMWVGLTEDITEHKRAEEELARRQTQLAQASRFNVLGEMMAGITHEITQPLTAIINFAGACSAILEDMPADSTELKSYIDEIRSQSSRAGQIVHSLRSLGRRAEVRREKCNLNELIRSAVALLRPDLRHSSVELLLHLDEHPATVLVDRIQIQQVIVNLVRNACDALQSTSTRPREIVLRTWLYSSWVVVECEDNGPGFTEDCQDRLFNAFFTTKVDGMGMGLAICRTIAEAHDGRISARNNSLRGATISVTLPLYQN